MGLIETNKIVTQLQGATDEELLYTLEELGKYKPTDFVEKGTSVSNYTLMVLDEMHRRSVSPNSVALTPRVTLIEDKSKEEKPISDELLAKIFSSPETEKGHFLTFEWMINGDAFLFVSHDLWLGTLGPLVQTAIKLYYFLKRMQHAKPANK